MKFGSSTQRTCPRRSHIRSFADGVSHCIFTPMLTWGEEQLAKGKDKCGVPEREFQDVVDLLGKYYCVHLTVELVCTDSG